MSPAVLAWFGNAAKMRIISEILATPGPKVVFDYGAGGGAGWAATLARHPEISLYCYEPSPSVNKLRQAVPSATIIEDLDAAELQADYIVSFSVFEHVFDRQSYLAYARRFLAPNGRFFLNYDDGHFRKKIELSDGSAWLPSVREHCVNLLAPIWPKIGQIGRYQARVDRDVADALVTEAGFSTVEARYENLASLKSLSSAVPDDAKASFAGRWLEIENQLNADFELAVTPRFGDRSLLWREMASRTLTLAPR